MFTWDTFVDLIKQYVDRDITEDVGESSTFDSIGINSITCIEILVDIEDMYGIEIPETLINETLFETLQAMYGVIKELIDNR